MAEATGKSFAARAKDADWTEGLRSYMAYRRSRNKGGDQWQSDGAHHSRQRTV